MVTGFNDLLLKFGQNPFMESRALNITVKWITQDGMKEKQLIVKTGSTKGSCKNVKEKCIFVFNYDPTDRVGFGRSSLVW